MDKSGEKGKNQKKKRTSRQLIALAGVILLVILYAATLVTALVDHSASAHWFRLSLAATLAIPLVIWLYCWMYARLTGKPTLGDPDTTGEDVQETTESTRKKG